MGKVDGFIQIKRRTPGYEPVEDRLQHWREFERDLPEEEIRHQGARCMDCGIPFCNWGCPLGNIIPDWNDLVYRGRWNEAITSLHATNNFPEVTGRVCPAPCEAACVLNVNDNAVTIRFIEKAISDRAFSDGWVMAEPPAVRTGKTVAVVGSGPAGMAAAQQLNRAGHTVTLFEKTDRIGGLLRYGIPDFKLEKSIVDRRAEQFVREGVMIETGVHVGRDYPVDRLIDLFDAVLLCGGAEKPRELTIPGHDLKDVHFAMEYLTQQNRRVAGEAIPSQDSMVATGKHVVILGGGDTGSDCLGTAHRQGAAVVYQFELLPKPPDTPSPETPWPHWPLVLRTSSSQEEGGQRDWSVLTKKLSGDARGHVQKLHAVHVEMGPPDASGRPTMLEVPGSEFEIECDLVLLAMGFVHPVHEGMIADLGVKLNGRGNVEVDENYMSSIAGVFTAGDMSRGQSLVVWAIADGRKAAAGVDRYLARR
ncbi:MAG: glutamate synthase subunit beta [Gemmatimonadetes bacterium]|nr:glutamate synthase subunit beta [Gemmatimonadota bacterium]